MLSRKFGFLEKVIPSLCELRFVVGHIVRPRRIASQLARADEIPVLHVLVVDLVTVHEVLMVFIPKRRVYGGPELFCPISIGFCFLSVPCEFRKFADRHRVRDHVAVDRGSKGVATSKAV